MRIAALSVLFASAARLGLGVPLPASSQATPTAVADGPAYLSTSSQQQSSDAHAAVQAVRATWDKYSAPLALAGAAVSGVAGWLLGRKGDNSAEVARLRGVLHTVTQERDAAQQARREAERLYNGAHKKLNRVIEGTLHPLQVWVDDVMAFLRLNRAMRRCVLVDELKADPDVS
jgi:hypothetical protein